MALLPTALMRRIIAQVVRPARSSAVANSSANLASQIGTLELKLNETLANGTSINIDHRTGVYVMTKAPLAAVTPDMNTLIPNPKIGDMVFCYTVDDATPDTPTAMSIWVYTRVTNASTGAVTGDPAWRLMIGS